MFFDLAIVPTPVMLPHFTLFGLDHDASHQKGDAQFPLDNRLHVKFFSMAIEVDARWVASVFILPLSGAIHKALRFPLSFVTCVCARGEFRAPQIWSTHLTSFVPFFFEYIAGRFRREEACAELSSAQLFNPVAPSRQQNQTDYVPVRSSPLGSHHGTNS